MATNRTTVNISITPELEAFLQSRVRSGRYQTTSEVVREALRLLERQEQDRDADLLRVRAQLSRGASQAERGEVIDGDEVHAELQELIAERRRAKATAAGADSGGSGRSRSSSSSSPPSSSLRRMKKNK